LNLEPKICAAGGDREAEVSRGEEDPDDAGTSLLLRHGSMGYHLRTSVGRGAFGEVWRALREEEPTTSHAAEATEATNNDPTRLSHPEQYYALKRIFVERGAELRASFAREAHFGALFRNASSRLHPTHPSRPSQVVRWVDSFEMHGGRELWLVFMDEGEALST
jgi:serine/threonine protein kinase